MSQKYEDILRDSIEKLSLGPDDIIIVKSPEAMGTFLEMTQKGVGFSKYANPILLVPGGLEKATEVELVEALAIVRKTKAETEEQTSKIITVLQ